MTSAQRFTKEIYIMTEKTEPTAEATPPTEEKLYALADETIALIREILQLTLYTGTNIIDHLRAVRLVESDSGKLVPNDKYVEEYNKMVAAFAEKAKQMAEEARLAAASARVVDEFNTTKH
ncbi:MAG TPA: hypothetical protein V6D20_23125 [Candidatus Obscuribacterales bacterium]